MEEYAYESVVVVTGIVNLSDNNATNGGANDSPLLCHVATILELPLLNLTGTQHRS